MTESDQITHSFCIYEIKRHTIKPYDFRWTNFYEDNLSFIQGYPDIRSDFAEDELIICSTIIDPDNYSLLTTRRIITKAIDIEELGDMTGATSYHIPLNYKFEKFGHVFGTVQFQKGDVFRYFLETAKASMVMIYGIKTLIWSQQLTDLQMINLMRLWDKREVKANL